MTGWPLANRSPEWMALAAEGRFLEAACPLAICAYHLRLSVYGWGRPVPRFQCDVFDW